MEPLWDISDPLGRVNNLGGGGGGGEYTRKNINVVLNALCK